MSKLISGKEALIALANGEEVEVKHPHDKWFEDWTLLNNIGGKFFLSSMLNDDGFVFRLKPRTITINGVEYIDKQGAYEAFMEVYNEMDIHPEI